MKKILMMSHRASAFAAAMILLSLTNPVWAKKNVSAAAGAAAQEVDRQMGLGDPRHPASPATTDQMKKMRAGTGDQQTRPIRGDNSVPGGLSSSVEREVRPPALSDNVCSVAPSGSDSGADATTLVVQAIQEGRADLENIFADALSPEGREVVVDAATDGRVDQLDAGVALLKAAVGQFVEEYKRTNGGRAPDLNNWNVKRELYAFLEDQFGLEVVEACLSRN